MDNTTNVFKLYIRRLKENGKRYRYMGEQAAPSRRQAISKWRKAHVIRSHVDYKVVKV